MPDAPTDRPDLRTAAQRAAADVELRLDTCPVCGVTKAHGAHDRSCSWLAFVAALAAEATEPPARLNPGERMTVEALLERVDAWVESVDGTPAPWVLVGDMADFLRHLAAGPAPVPQGADEPSPDASGQAAARYADHIAAGTWPFESCPEFCSAPGQGGHPCPGCPLPSERIAFEAARRAAAVGAPGEPGDDDLTELRQRVAHHRQNRDLCAACSGRWPCVTARLLAEIDRRGRHVHELSESLAEAGVWIDTMRSTSDRELCELRDLHAAVAHLPLAGHLEDARTLIDALPGLLAEVERLRAAADALAAEAHETEQVLAAALPDEFPTLPDSDDRCTGEHVLPTLAAHVVNVLRAAAPASEDDETAVSDALADLTQRLDLATAHATEGATLLLALHFPDLDPSTTDPDALADAVAAPIAAHGARVEVNALPAPQWLGPMAVAAIRDLVSIPAAGSPPPTPAPTDPRPALYAALTRIVGDIGAINDESSRRTAAHMLRHYGAQVREAP